MTRSQILLVVVLVPLLVVSGKAAAAEWEAVGPDDAKIVFYGPGLFGTGQFAKRSIHQLNQHFGMWVFGSDYPRAEIYIEELWPNFVRKRGIQFENVLKQFEFLKGARLDLNAKQKVVNVLGRIEYYKFRFHDLHCVGFGQHYGVGLSFENDYGVPPNYLIGYYCDDETLSDDTVEAVVHGIGVKDYKVPPAPSN